MTKTLFLTKLLLLLLTGQAFAKIIHVSKYEVLDDRIELFLSTGEVLEIRNVNLYQIKNELDKSEVFEAEFDEDHVVHSISPARPSSAEIPNNENRRGAIFRNSNNRSNRNRVRPQTNNSGSGFSSRASNLNSYDQGQRFFNGMNKSYSFTKSGRCYSRAHVWSYELFKNYKVVTEKVFLFFTSTYRRMYNYKWWFHVSPGVFIQSRFFVLDRAFSSGPTPLRNWTNQFVKSARTCQVIKNMQTYHYHDNRTAFVNPHCFVRVVPMGYYQPNEIEKLDSSGQGKANKFYNSQLNHAYEVFNRRY
ncbi:protein-glutamine glutaminase family protein [bacterium]|nr:protein-glutamine glutaminase family protein [bacterium]